MRAMPAKHVSVPVFVYGAMHPCIFFDNPAVGMHSRAVQPLLETFFDPASCSLKICGVIRADDAQGLVDRKVHALGVNFWPLSKRFISPDDAAPWLRDVAGKILRVGVFVNARPDYIAEVFRSGIIDAAQLHGDESPGELAELQAMNIPCIKACGIRDAGDLDGLSHFAHADGLLLDTAAPGVYGGTGHAFDWSLAQQAGLLLPTVPLLLAGGITPANAAEAVSQVHPAALDVASGAEVSPGVKDFAKVDALLRAL